MCKQLCEQTNHGRMLWERWRTFGDNWQAVSDFHREAVLAEMRSEAAQRGTCTVFLCPRDESSERPDMS